MTMLMMWLQLITELVMKTIYIICFYVGSKLAILIQPSLLQDETQNEERKKEVSQTDEKENPSGLVSQMLCSHYSIRSLHILAWWPSFSSRPEEIKQRAQ